MSDRGKMERTAFEAWAREYGMIAADRGDMTLAWEAWQAAIAALRAHRGSADASPPAPAWSGERPEVVCLCGSTRFKDAFVSQNERLTLAGAIVLSVGSFGHSRPIPLTEKEKSALDELHKRKIDLCDRVLVLNVGGYIGASTRSEIEYAHAHGKPVDYLEPLTPPGAAS